MKTKDSPDGLKPYIFHGLELDINGKEAIGECPLCGRENKFSINIQSSKWRCFVCGESGNQISFLRKLCDTLSAEDLSWLSSHRKVDEGALEEWGIVYNPLNESFNVPGFNAAGEIVNLYKYARMRGGKYKLLSTPTVTHGIFGIDLYDKTKPIVYLCEGPWDAIRLYSILATSKEKAGKFIRTREGTDTLIQHCNVLAVPGCSTFNKSWRDVFVGKKVYVVFDNDYPKKHPKTKRKIEAAALSGLKQFSSVIGKEADLNYLRWGTDHYHDPNLPDHSDIRDIINSPRDLPNLIGRLHPVPEEWKQGKSKGASNNGSEAPPSLKPRKCESWEELISAWEKALKWTEGLDRALSVALACVMSTELPGDQLWIKMVGPASCGKTTLCEAISVSQNFVLAKSTLRGFHSGFKEGKGSSSEDNSLLVQVNNKTLVTKDGDTLLQSPNLSQILAEARDIYDGDSRTHYRNNMGKDYTNIKMTWLLCGTASLRSIDSSELGERFLDTVIMDGIDDIMEDEVLMRVALREENNMTSITTSTDGRQDSDLKLAKELTGGYVEYLRMNVNEIMSNVVASEEALKMITRIGKFVSYMRARPSKMQQENAEREFAARLVSQHLKLARCLAGVLNMREVGREALRRTVKVARDTSRGITADICQVLFEEGSGTPQSLSLLCNQTDVEIRKLLRFMKAIGMVEEYQKKVGHVRTRKMWRMSKKFRALYREVTSYE